MRINGLGWERERERSMWRLVQTSRSIDFSVVAVKTSAGSSGSISTDATTHTLTHQEAGDWSCLSDLWSRPWCTSPSPSPPLSGCTKSQRGGVPGWFCSSFTSETCEVSVPFDGFGRILRGYRRSEWRGFRYQGDRWVYKMYYSHL